MLTGVSFSFARGGYWDDDDWNRSGLFLDGGIGVYCGDVNNELGIEANIGYRLHLVDGLCWDIAKGGVQLWCADGFSDSSTARFLTGFRYNTPRFVGDKSLYVSTAFGYQFMWGETDINGLAYEVGAGVNLSSKVALGINWNGSNSSFKDYFNFKWGLLSLRFNYLF